MQALLLGPRYSWSILLDESFTRAAELTDLVATMVTSALATNLLPTRTPPALGSGDEPGPARPPPGPHTSSTASTRRFPPKIVPNRGVP